jgi:(2Fe-2S) ferredoxin
MQALQTELDDRGLTDHVTIRGTGCMKQCKAGPNLVMPDKSRYTRIRPDQVAGLIDQHFPGSNEIAS